jgi:hypothetical protein
MLLFLDFDGVLHPDVVSDPALLFCKLPLLEGVLRKLPGIEVVISSTWRETRTLDELRMIFSPDIRETVIGATPHWSDVQDPFEHGSYVRQSEVSGWLKQNNRAWEPWIALDDKPYLFKPFLPNLVRCDPRTGLTQDVVEKLIQKLSGIV